MDEKSIHPARGREGVSGLTSDDVYGVPMNENSLAFVDASKPADTISPPTPYHDSLPTRRIELRYWLAALAAGLAIWAAILFWLL